MVDKEGVEVAFVHNQLIAVAKTCNRDLVAVIRAGLQLACGNLEMLFRPVERAEPILLPRDGHNGTSGTLDLKLTFAPCGCAETGDQAQGKTGCFHLIPPLKIRAATCQVALRRCKQG